MLNAVQEAIAMGRKCGSIPVKINEFEVKGSRVHRGRYTLASLACLALGITFGLLLVLLVRRKDIKIWMFYKECSLEHTTKILVKLKDSFGIFYEEDVYEERYGYILQPKTSCLVNIKVKYVWDIQTLGHFSSLV
uniref:Cation-transporting ATPase n=1 Tax=Daphnia galeata TaxID=27404 RepID=A0A8J2RGD2_9CRUS|nr:unnamed protein product [Daphnia galeata]